MSPQVNGSFVTPGVFTAVQNNVLPTGGQGVRIPAIIGTGRTTNLVSNEQVTRGATSTDTLAHTATAIDGNITDANYITYYNGVDFILSSGVAWQTLSAQFTSINHDTYNGLVGKTLILAVASGALQTYTFLVGDFVAPTAATALEVKTAILANFTGVTNTVVAVSGGNNFVKIATTATSSSSLYIGAGTANTILGFLTGSYAATPQQPALGVKYYVTYEYAKVTADYVPKFYFNLSSVVNDYGAVSTSTTASLGASLAFQNGAAEVCVCQQNPADGSPVSQVQSALNKLLATQNISIVVSLEGAANAQLLPAIKQHVDTASSTINKLERTAIVGFDETATTYTDANMIAYAAAVNDNRVVLLNSSTVSNTLFVGNATTVSTVGSQFVAAALAGVRCNPAYDVAQPMTREVISGFVSIANTLVQAEKAQLINQGVCVIDNLQGVPKVLFGTTTNFADIADQLYQITQIMDYCAQTLRGLLDPIFIGQKLLANTPSQVATVVSAILSTIQQSNIIVSFTQPVVTVDANDATRLDVQVGIVPVTEVDVIFITLGLNLI